MNRSTPSSNAQMPPDPPEPKVPMAVLWLTLSLFAVAGAGILLDSMPLLIIGLGGLLVVVRILMHLRSKARFGPLPEVPVWLSVVAAIVAAVSILLQFGPQALQPESTVAERVNQTLMAASILVLMWPGFTMAERKGELRQWRKHP